MPATFILVPNGDAATIEGSVTIRSQTSVVNLLALPSLPAGSPINATITKFPRGQSGMIRVRVGLGGGTFTLTLTASDIIGGIIPRSIPLSIAGPGDYLWPANRKSLATALTKITGPAPGGTVAVEMLRTEGLVAGDAATGVLGLLKSGSSVAPGGMMQVVTSGPALATCSGGWSAGDLLCTAADGALRKVGDTETGIDVVATADADQIDGDTDCPVTVDLQAV